MALVAALLLAPMAHGLELDCSNGADDDLDGPADCADDDCFRDGACMFSVTRNFKLQRDPGTGRAFLNYYFVSWPELTGLQDVANTGDPSNNKCVGDPGSPPGPTAGDGFLNADDILCTFWTSRMGAMQVFHYRPQDCAFEVRNADRSAWGIRFSGGWTSYVMGLPDPNQALDTDRTSNPTALDDYRFVGYALSVGDYYDPVAAWDNVGTLEGWCDDSWTGQVITNLPCEPSRHYLHYPFGSLYRTADEILCGLEGFDWSDGDGDGDPDDCPSGIFDGDTQVSVYTFDNDPATRPETDNLFVPRTVIRVDGALVFLGRDFDLAAGEAYVVETSPAQRPTLWRPPTDGVKCR